MGNGVLRVGRRAIGRARLDVRSGSMMAQDANDVVLADDAVILDGIHHKPLKWTATSCTTVRAMDHSTDAAPPTDGPTGGCPGKSHSPAPHCGLRLNVTLRDIDGVTNN